MIIKNYTLKFVVGLLITAILFNSCQKDEEPTKPVAAFDASIALRWNQMFLEVERHAGGYRPGPANRALAYLGLAAYQACVSGMPDHKSMESQMPGLALPSPEVGKEYHWPTVVHSSYSTLMHRFFPSPSDELATRMSNLEESMETQYRMDCEVGVALGYLCGRRVNKLVWWK